MQDLSSWGDIRFVQRSNSRSIRVTIQATKLTVSYGSMFTLADVKRYLAENATEILEKQTQIRKKTAERKPNLISPENPLQTLTFQVLPTPSEVERIHFRLADGLLKAHYPERMTTEEIQPYLWEGINYFLRKEAKRLFPQRTAELAALHGFTYNTVKIQASKTRWGSCSTKKNINLSFFLLLAPQNLIDYVILHELCHTIEMNHSNRFWALMDKVTDGKAKQLRNGLKSIQIP